MVNYNITKYFSATSIDFFSNKMKSYEQSHVAPKSVDEEIPVEDSEGPAEIVESVSMECTNRSDNNDDGDRQMLDTDADEEVVHAQNDESGESTKKPHDNKKDNSGNTY